MVEIFHLTIICKTTALEFQVKRSLKNPKKRKLFGNLEEAPPHLMPPRLWWWYGTGAWCVSPGDTGTSMLRMWRWTDKVEYNEVIAHISAFSSGNLVMWTTTQHNLNITATCLQPHSNKNCANHQHIWNFSLMLCFRCSLWTLKAGDKWAEFV